MSKICEFSDVRVFEGNQLPVVCLAKQKYILWGNLGKYQIVCEKHYFENRKPTGWRSMVKA
jgi:hypothetical protein